MINLRFHIVSIVAVFLALAIGILTGSTLLDRATVEVLQSRQKSLDTRNDDLKAENDRLRTLIDLRNDAQQGFGSQAIPAVLDGLLDREPVLILAVRGIDEDVVNVLQATIGVAGGQSLGVVWFDATFDLTNDESLARIATALGLDTSGRNLSSTVADTIAAELATPAVPPDETVDPTTTTAPERPSEVLSALSSAQLIDWRASDGSTVSSSTLPATGLRVVLVSGEGAELSGEQLLYPLVSALAADEAGIVVAEQRNSRRDLTIIDDDVPGRGALVNPLRLDSDLADRVITVDNLDEPFGRLAVILSIAGYPSLVSGAFGTAPSADQFFPTTLR